MGMMTRRNVKQRAVKKAAPVSNIVSKSGNNDFSQSMDLIEDNAEVKYTKTNINRMSTSELKRLGTQVGVNNASEMNGSDLKIELIKHFDL